MQSVVETHVFLRHAKECGVSEDERAEIVSYIAAYPTAGDEMPGTGGARKLRFARPGQGKRGGYRIITFYSGVDIPVFLLSIYAKNVRKDISQKEKNEIRKLAKILPVYGKETKQ
jgi:hypothetical protein